MTRENTDYWDKRAYSEYLYRGEKLYTITAAPYYVKRRKIVVDAIRKLVSDSGAKRVADIGCGDGEYIYLIQESDKEYCGIDISDKMLDLARDRLKEYPNVSFELSGNGPHQFNNIDLAFIVATLAHINDNSIDEILLNTYPKIKSGGLLCICEQTAPYDLKGSGWERRTFQDYVEKLEKASFQINLEKSFRIDFRVHRVFFERHIAKWFFKRKNRIECNRDWLYICLSNLCAHLSIKRKWKPSNGWGYIFIVAEKQGEEEL